MLSEQFEQLSAPAAEALESTWHLCAELGLHAAHVLAMLILAEALGAHMLRAACLAAVVDQFPFVSGRPDWASPYLAAALRDVLAAVPLGVLERAPASPALVAALSGAPVPQQKFQLYPMRTRS